MFITCVSGSKTVLCWLMHTLSCSCTSLYLTCILFFFLQAGLTQASKSSSTSSPSLQCMVTMYLLHAINNLDYSASNNNWFIPLFTPLHVIKHCPY